MSKFRVTALEKHEMAEFQFPVMGEPDMRHHEFAKYYLKTGDMEHVKQRAGWNANSIGRDNVLFLRRCTTDHLKAIIANVNHIRGTFTVDIIKSILEERDEKV